MEPLVEWDIQELGNKQDLSPGPAHGESAGPMDPSSGRFPTL